MMKYLLIATALLCLAYSAEAQDKPYCSLCETIVTYTEFILDYTGETNATAIDDYVFDMCESLPAPINTACETLVTVYLEEIVKELTSGTPAASVCGNVGLCSSSTPAKKPVTFTKKDPITVTSWKKVRAN